MEARLPIQATELNEELELQRFEKKYDKYKKLHGRTMADKFEERGDVDRAKELREQVPFITFEKEVLFKVKMWRRRGETETGDPAKMMFSEQRQATRARSFTTFDTSNTLAEKELGAIERCMSLRKRRRDMKRRIGK